MLIMEKYCITCKVKQPITEYYVHKEMKDGHLNKCKKCVKNYSKNNKTVPRTCVICEKDFMANKNEVKRRTGGANTCSRKCWYKYLPIKQKEKWDSIGRTEATLYTRAHRFIYCTLGKAMKCEVCDVKDRPVYHWANISNTYALVVTDWKQMCPSCHKKYDNKMFKETGVRAMKNIKAEIPF
jgi:hypothetical protein